MQPASADTVLGDFADAHFEDANGSTDFRREGERFLVDTTGPDGARATFEVSDVFGFTPLQQVLLPLASGKQQALTVAWDTDERRWYSLYPAETIPAGDPLHWTRPALNWNFSCADCHATGLRRNYDAARDAYATSAARFDVGCQACHGPAEKHLAWVTEKSGQGPGFDAPLGGPESWRELEACARCHARRAPLGDGFDHSHRLMDDFLPALLDENLYFADGQILDEVYEYGSFLQTKMHAKNVRCSDCHEPHALRLRQEGNLLCATCHSATPTLPAHVDGATLARKNYDSPEHHRHAPGTEGSRCVDCHMPARTYMGVDERRDHGFRVPRPDLAARMASPDPCASCHDEGAEWAAAKVREWFGPKRAPEPFGVALAAGRAGTAGAADALLALVASQEPALVRASALELLTRYPGQSALEAFVRGTRDPDGLVRHAALGGLEGLTGEQRLPFVGPLLSDPLRAVRSQAARLLFELPAGALGPFAAAFEQARDEYEAIQRGLLERPESRLNLAQLLASTARAPEAGEELRAALRLEPRFTPARVNLAELARSTAGESEVEGTLRDGLGRGIDDASTAALHHALGLALARQGRGAEARPELARAAELAPHEPRFGYVHAIALHDGGEPEAALRVLVDVLARAPWYRDAAFALAGYRAETGDEPGARAAMEALAAINPHDPGLAPVDPRTAPR
jgi:predicted Zn-dependent protease